MIEAVCTEIDGKSIMIYRGTGEALPVVYSNDYGKSGEAVLKRCREIGCPPFHLVSVFNVGWDQNMSPWPSEPVVAEEAGRYLSVPGRQGKLRPESGTAEDGICVQGPEPKLYKQRDTIVI